MTTKTEFLFDNVSAIEVDFMIRFFPTYAQVFQIEMGKLDLEKPENAEKYKEVREKAVKLIEHSRAMQAAYFKHISKKLYPEGKAPELEFPADIAKYL